MHQIEGRWLELEQKALTHMPINHASLQVGRGVKKNFKFNYTKRFYSFMTLNESKKRTRGRIEPAKASVAK